MKKYFPLMTLLFSTSTLICCALPALLVFLGLGGALAGMISTFPQLIWFSENKNLVFTIAGILIFTSAITYRFSIANYCPTDPALRAACEKSKTHSFWILSGSISIYLIGLFFAFVAGCSNKAPPSKEVLNKTLRIINVTNSSDFTSALNSSIPGDKIIMEPGTYIGRFTITSSGLSGVPIEILSSSDDFVVIDGGDQGVGNCLSLNNSRYIKISNLIVQNCKKGIVLDNSSDNILSNITLRNIGEEALHLRTHSSNNIISSNKIYNTGTINPGFGEGIYIGSAESNWCAYTSCNPDKSDSNIISYNNIYSTRAEAVDIKEGTTGNMIFSNIMDANLISGDNFADSLIDAKGNSTSITGNIFKNSAPSFILDAIQIHVKVIGWGKGNLITQNILQSQIPGFGIRSDSISLHSGNIIKCDNKFSLAASGSQNSTCQ